VFVLFSLATRWWVLVFVAIALALVYDLNKNEFVVMLINRNALAHIFAWNDFARGICGFILWL